ncbi:hypothetical protein DSCA_31180 [Desulfosarcina alkanivorans]|jgi:hypothetical protein|uniref:Uncharacterized protein n=1 Tax=Desulfosarcina alkanivorans TaxID=571177 RepID=A0A5K7YJZ5_9BACT|nr:hypothetical protein [Desulfosarcina alkanivorans]BBO69188.1 hypothetical protein DSCA_31180 [Desulfosarcina alkanivorans]
MERRKTETRRQDHLFVADDRRGGPYDRRGDAARRRERMKEKEKIERIRAFKAKDRQKPSASGTPMVTRKRLMAAGLILLVVIITLILLR